MDIIFINVSYMAEWMINVCYFNKALFINVEIIVFFSSFQLFIDF